MQEIRVVDFILQQEDLLVLLTEKLQVQVMIMLDMQYRLML